MGPRLRVCYNPIMLNPSRPHAPHPLLNTPYISISVQLLGTMHVHWKHVHWKLHSCRVSECQLESHACHLTNASVTMQLHEQAL